MKCLVFVYYNFLYSSRKLKGVFSASVGDHTVEERRRGQKEHVPPGRHRLPKVRGLGRFRERAGKGCTRGGGGERVEPLPSSLLSHDSSASAWWSQPADCTTSGPTAVLALAAAGKGRKKGDRRTVIQCVNNENVCMRH